MLDLQSFSVQQGELDLEPESDPDKSRLMTAIDTLNSRFGKGTVHVASAGFAGPLRSWGMRQERLTPQYTTSWADIPVARA